MAEIPDPKQLKEAEKFVKLMKAKATKAILCQCKRWRQDLTGAEVTWNSLDKRRREDNFIMATLELVGGAKFPPKSDFKRCEHWIANVENGVAKNYHNKLPQWMENAESSIKTVEAKLRSYVSRLDGGSDFVVIPLVGVKAFGLVAVGILAVLFVGPAVVSTLALEAGSVAAAMAMGATASVITKNVEIVANTFGRGMSGENLNLEKEVKSAVAANKRAVIIGMFLGPAGRAINANVTAPIFKGLALRGGKKFTPEAAELITRMTVATFTQFYRIWSQKEGKREVSAAVKKVNNKINNKMSKDAVMLLVLTEASKTTKFCKALSEYAKKNAGKK